MASTLVLILNVRERGELVASCSSLNMFTNIMGIYSWDYLITMDTFNSAAYTACVLGDVVCIL